MSDMLGDALASLTADLGAFASVPVTYARGAETVAVNATLGKKLLKLDDGDGGIRMEWTDLDFLIPSAGLLLSGDPVIPERGDMIYLPRVDGTQTYEVASYGGEPPWHWCDPGQTMMRVHAKRVGATS